MTSPQSHDCCTKEKASHSEDESEKDTEEETFKLSYSGRCSLVVKSFASEVFDFHRHCDLEVRYTREGMTDCWVICGQGNRSTVPSCKLGCDCMDSHLYPCHIGD